MRDRRTSYSRRVHRPGLWRRHGHGLVACDNSVTRGRTGEAGPNEWGPERIKVSAHPPEQFWVLSSSMVKSEASGSAQLIAQHAAQALSASAKRKKLDELDTNGSSKKKPRTRVRCVGAIIASDVDMHLTIPVRQLFVR